jgi:hypothetical protein
MTAMVAAMWINFWLENYSPEIAKPAEEAGRAYRQRPGKSLSGKHVFSHLSVFCKRFLATGGLVPISGRFWRVA